ncbi:MAG: potassium channel family protein [bacterium]|nr:potassium channel family protein [bacterium]
MLFEEIQIFFTVVIYAAAIYRAYAPYIGLETSSSPAWDALYVSIVTISTLGFGDHVPRDCLRLVVMAEVLVGMFIVIIGIARLVGKITGYMGNHDQTTA